MSMINLTVDRDNEFITQVETLSGQKIANCYQCGNCTAGCPYSFSYDIPVHKMMRLVQMGQKKTALSSNSIWLCATCTACTTRCPNQIDVAGIMDSLRNLARRNNFCSVKNVKYFYDAFLSSVSKHGRVFEIGTVATYISKSLRIFTDIDLAPIALSKRKMSFKAHNIVGKNEVKAIFERFEEYQKKQHDEAK